MRCRRRSRREVRDYFSPVTHVGPQRLDVVGLQQAAPGRHLVLAAGTEVMNARAGRAEMCAGRKRSPRRRAAAHGRASSCARRFRRRCWTCSGVKPASCAAAVPSIAMHTRSAQNSRGKQITRGRSEDADGRREVNAPAGHRIGASMSVGRQSESRQRSRPSRPAARSAAAGAPRSTTGRRCRTGP